MHIDGNDNWMSDLILDEANALIEATVDSDGKHRNRHGTFLQTGQRSIITSFFSNN